MQRVRKKWLAVILVLAMAFGGMMPSMQTKAAGETTQVTILQTSDLHGMINPFDYASNKDNSTSLAHVATIVKAERAANPNLLLIDTGDSTQANYIQEFKDDEVNPMMAALNYLGYNTWTLGNHEFNFGFPYVEKYISQFKGMVLAGNIYKADGTRWQNAYNIFDVNGVRVAIFGITAPHVPTWEKSDPTHYNNMSFTTPMDETGKILAELQGKADVIIGSVHYGEDGEYNTDGMRAVAQKYGSQIDALFIGHAHSKLSETVNGVPIIEPGSNGAQVGKLQLTLVKDATGWKVTGKEGSLIDASKVAPDAEFLAQFKDLDTRSRALASRQVGEVGETFLNPVSFLPGIPISIIQDGPILDLINKVQMKETGADVSLAALFDSSSNLEKGPFLNRDSVKIYKYDNTLYAVRLTGKQLKAIMERQAGNFFNQYQPGDVTISFNPDIRMYNYDAFAGVNYDINISKPAGSRIENVMFKGVPLTDDQVLVLALNNYRYGGLVEAGLINESDVVYEGGAVRDMIGNYVASLGASLMPECDNNWKITGADLNDPQKDLIYSMVLSGQLTIPTSADGRTPNIAALNGPALRAQGLLPAIAGETAVAPTFTGDGYIVQKGDCLWNIAKKVYNSGAKWNRIFEANKDKIKDAGKLRIGQQLVLPAAE